ncbi:single-stranded DNA-binding protein, mitochondrial-like isoform X2 [Patiria miniata]|uniref:Single-stranded DNA-binding protein, mitochondrial n=1 Tax=Patiria miniata TaxID=46514 RepID=A0A914BBX7_PATMI|nr:single-stranded DNA-binding protein, mitochondrial-like isoform X2 [Patiria miniata]
MRFERYDVDWKEHLKLCRYLGRGYSTTVKTVETGVVERSLNKVTLLGRVGRDAELRGQGANPVALFPLATSETFRVKRDSEEDELKQRTSWHRINVFKPGLRDSVFTYCKKGSRVLVTGRINYSEYFNDSDQKIMSTNIIADDVIFVGSEPKLSDSDLQYEG